MVTWYARSLGQVVLLLAGSAVVSLVFALTGRGAPGWLVVIFACVALGTVVSANIHQERSRNTLATHGVVPAA